MLERFTERARRVILIAIEEARSRQHEAVGPEHLLLGILQVGGDAVHTLGQLHVSPDTLRAEVERVLSEIPGSVTDGDPSFSPEFTAVLEAALSVRRRLTVDTNLLLIALADEHPPISAILRAAGADRRLMLPSFRKPVTEEEVRFITTSRWRVRL